MCHATHKSGHFSRLLVPARQGGSALLDQPARFRGASDPVIIHQRDACGRQIVKCEKAESDAETRQNNGSTGEVPRKLCPHALNEQARCAEHWRSTAITSNLSYR